MVWTNGHLGVEGRDPTMTLSDVVFLPRGSVTMSAPSYKVSMANQSRIPPEFTWGAMEVSRLPEQGQVLPGSSCIERLSLAWMMASPQPQGWSPLRSLPHIWQHFRAQGPFHHLLLRRNLDRQQDQWHSLPSEFSYGSFATVKNYYKAEHRGARL